MSSTFVTIVGFIIIITFCVSVYKEILTAQMAFIILPIVGALVLGFNFTDISAWIIEGISGSAGRIAMVIFSITFFATMNAVGAFDDVVNFILKKFSNSLMAIVIAGWLVATVSTLDGAAPSTILVTVSAMLPIYKKVKIRPLFLGLQCALVTGCLSIVPYGGVNLGLMSVLGTDAYEFFSPALLVAIVSGYILGFCINVFYAKREFKRIANGENDYLLEESGSSTTSAAVNDYTPRMIKMRRVNVVLIVPLSSACSQASFLPIPLPCCSARSHLL